MSKFGTKEEIVKAIENHFTSMQTGKMSMGDLELLVEQARELYERVVVLRFKAYEEKVFGEAKEVLSETTEANTLEALEEEQEVLPQDESFELEATPEIVDIQVEGEPVFDFSLFDEPVSETQESHSNDEVIEIETQATNEYLEDEAAPEEITFEQEDENTPLPLEEPSFSQEEAHAVEFTNEIHSFDETPAHEEIENAVEPEAAPEQARYESDKEDIFYNILNAGDNSLASRLMQSRLDTLVGSFGFNEKFQCIQDLFKGSSDDFNQAIDVLDNMHSFDEAKEQLQYYVRLNNWDLNSEITAEFVRKIERRFR